MSLELHIDETDRQILRMLIQDASRSYNEIGRILGLSGGTIHVRMKKMQEAGIVKGSTLLLDAHKLGFDVTAFLGIFLEKSAFYSQALEELKKIPEISFVHYTTGAYSMFAKIICRDTAHLREVLHEKIQNVPGIERTETLISLEESFNRHISI